MHQAQKNQQHLQAAVIAPATLRLWRKSLQTRCDDRQRSKQNARTFDGFLEDYLRCHVLALDRASRSMNFLVHCALALKSRRWPQGHTIRQGLLATYFADFGKGPIDKSLPLDLQTGIRLHRRIDAFSNQHQAIRDRCATFPLEYAATLRYSSIFLATFTCRRIGPYYYAFSATLSRRCYEACEIYSVYLSTEQATQMTRFLVICAVPICWPIMTIGSILSTLRIQCCADSTNCHCRSGQ